MWKVKVAFKFGVIARVTVNQLLQFLIWRKVFLAVLLHIQKTGHDM